MFMFIIQVLIDKVPRSLAEAFARLYDEFMPKVFKYVSYRIADIDEAEDITSSVFEKALTNFNKYNEDKASFSTWIFTIARNTLTDHYRSSSKNKDLQTEVLTDAMINGSYGGDDLITEEDKKVLRAYIAQLSKQEQEIIALKFGSEMTNRQIAKNLELSESNVGIIIYRTVRKLRDKFAEVSR